MKINTMKLKLTALLLVLYTGLYAQNKIVLTAPRLDTSSLSNRINLKANTNLNNVNGVLSSTYGGAGSVSGILKADGSGVVSPVIASDITTLISGTYLPLSGGTLTGALNGTSAAFSGAARGERIQVGTSGTINDAAGVGQTLQFGNYSAGAFVSGSADAYIYKTSSSFGGLSAQTLILQTRSDVSGGGVALVYGSTPSVGFYMNGNGNVLINTTTESPNNEALQVAGSGLFSPTNATAYIEIASSSSSYQSTVYFKEGASRKWEISKVPTTADLDFYTYGTSSSALKLAYSTGAATFSSSVTALGGNFNTSTGGSSLILANTGAQNSNGLEIRGGTAGTTVNWKIEKDNTLSQNLQFTPSTANGGTSFTTPVLSLSSTGAITASSSVTAGGILKGVGFNQPISVKTADYTLTASDHTVMFNNAAGNLTATLPAGVEGRIYVIGYLDTNNNLTITPNGSETIGGAASFTLQSSTCLGAITIQFLSGNWYIISTNYNASCL